ncbi:MAG: response regulator transcription factor [Phycisphaerales bacterium]
MDAHPDIPDSTPPMRVLCVDDSADMTAVMRMVIDAEPMMECVGCLASADDLVERVRGLNAGPAGAALGPLVVLLDATMPGKSPLKAMSEVAAAFPEVRTIIYSGHDDEAFVDRARSAGAQGCVCKKDDPETIVRAVREVAAGGEWWPGARTRG